MNTTIYYHADCLDGFGAAYAAWCRYGDSALYRPMHHGDPWQPEEVSGRDVYILDYTFAPEQLLAMAGAAHTVTLLDHHETARQPWDNDLCPAGDTALEFRHPTLALTLHFDMARSGARLAWEHFHPDRELPAPLAHVEDIDLWRFALPGTRAFCRALRMQPWAFARWHQIVHDADLRRQLLSQGEAIETFFNLEVQRLADSRLLAPVTLKGDPVDPLQAVRHGQPVIEEGDRSWLAARGVAINANGLFASELGNILAERHGGFALIWEVNDQQIAKVSLRACGAVNVARIAENYGGGGHPNAAGFRMPASQLIELLGQK